MQYVRRVDVLEGAQHLVGEVADVISAECLRLQELVKIRLHQSLHYIHVLHLLHCRRDNHVAHIDDVLVVECGKNLDLSERALAESLVLEWRHLLNRHPLTALVVRR